MTKTICHRYAMQCYAICLLGAILVPWWHFGFRDVTFNRPMSPASCPSWLLSNLVTIGALVWTPTPDRQTDSSRLHIYMLCMWSGLAAINEPINEPPSGTLTTAEEFRNFPELSHQPLDCDPITWRETIKANFPNFVISPPCFFVQPTCAPSESVSSNCGSLFKKER